MTIIVHKLASFSMFDYLGLLIYLEIEFIFKFSDSFPKLYLLHKTGSYPCYVYQKPVPIGVMFTKNRFLSMLCLPKTGYYGVIFAKCVSSDNN